MADPVMKTPSLDQDEPEESVRMNPSQLRSEISVLGDIVYLDAASVCPSPQHVLRAVEAYNRDCPFNYGVGVFAKSMDAARRVDEARASIAGFVGAGDAREIVFTKNTTEAINVVAASVELTAGDEIILTSLEHQSNILPWLRRAEKSGARVQYVEPDANGLIRPAAVEACLSKRTRLVAITHVSNVIGIIQPVTDIAQMVKRASAKVFVDAAQSGGRVPIDVRAIGCDFMVFCGRKSLMGPQGTGFLWGRLEELDRLCPLNIGSRSADLIDSHQWKFTATPHRFEAGVLNTAGVIGLGAAAELLKRIGLDRILQHNRALTARMVEGLASIDGVTIHGPSGTEHQAGIISWSVEGRGAHDVARALDQGGAVAVASGPQGSALAMRHLGVREVVRSSVHYFSSEQDIAALIDGVERIARRA
ncbi:MAG: cysteine desulfurase [Hyphomicrobiaceae bacterium]|nr:cysteine desulfurase [Hyphomicrobiaceae bacterium]